MSIISDKMPFDLDINVTVVYRDPINVARISLRRLKLVAILRNTKRHLRLDLVEFSFDLGEDVFQAVPLLLQTLVLAQSLVQSCLHLSQRSLHRLLRVAAVALKLGVQLLTDLLLYHTTTDNALPMVKVFIK